MSAEKRSSEIPLNANEMILLISNATEPNTISGDCFSNQPKKLPKVYELNENEYTVCDYEFVTGIRTNSCLIYDRDEKQLFTNSVNGSKFGVTYRCQERKCRARRILCDNKMLIKMNNSKPHNHDSNKEQIVKNLRALNSWKSQCGQIASTLCGSKKSNFLRSTFKRVPEE